MRRRLSDGQHFLVLCLFAGLFCELTAVAFHLAIHHLFEWLWQQAESRGTPGFCGILLAAPTLAGLVVGLADLHHIGDWIPAYPVLDDAGRLCAMARHDQLENPQQATSVGELVRGQQCVTITPTCPIRDAANRMIERNLQQVPVGEPLEPGKMTGWLTLNDIARQQNAVEI